LQKAGKCSKKELLLGFVSGYCGNLCKARRYDFGLSFFYLPSTNHEPPSTISKCQVGVARLKQPATCDSKQNLIFKIDEVMDYIKHQTSNIENRKSKIEHFLSLNFNTKTILMQQ
jgi:hypothetical protein